MPSRTAYKRCSHGVFLPVRMQRYKDVAAQVREILHSFTPAVEPVSIDEAFLDVGSVLGASVDAVSLGRRLTGRVCRLWIARRCLG